MAAGFDCVNDLTAYGTAIRESGYVWVGRYLDTGSLSSLKVYLSPNEAQCLSRAGLTIISIFESDTIDSAYFTSDRGEQDGKAAVAAAKNVAQPAEGTPIYFAVDFDAKESDLDAIGTYFEAARAQVKNAGYVAGVYGSGKVCKYLSEIGYVSNTWLAESTGWAGYNDWFPQASIVQMFETNLNFSNGSSQDDLDVDLGMSNGHAGGWETPLSD